MLPACRSNVTCRQDICLCRNTYAYLHLFLLLVFTNDGVFFFESSVGGEHKSMNIFRLGTGRRCLLTSSSFCHCTARRRHVERVIHDLIRVGRALLFENTRSERRTFEGEQQQQQLRATISRRQDHRISVASGRNEMHTRPAAHQGQWIRIIKETKRRASARLRYSSRVR